MALFTITINVDAMLLLTRSAVLLSSGIVQYARKEDARVPLKILPIFWLW